jgi:hypothetical protein
MFRLRLILRLFGGSFQSHEMNTVKSCPMTAFWMLDDNPPACLDRLILRLFGGSFQCHEMNTVKSCPMTAFFYISGHCCTVPDSSIN